LNTAEVKIAINITARQKQNFWLFFQSVARLDLFASTQLIARP